MNSLYLPTEKINELAHALAQSRQRSTALRALLERLWGDADYRNWFDRGRLSKEPYRVPGEFARALGDYGLVESGILRCQVHRVMAEIFLTDLPSLDRKIAAYPYTSESEDIHEFISGKDLYEWADCVVDLFCGCGHHLIAGAAEFWPSNVKRIGFDINERALGYARINAKLNETDVVIARHDVNDVLPFDLISAGARRVLFLANAPFLPSPLPDVLPPTMDGGLTGLDLTVRAMNAVLEFWRAKHLQVQGIFLTASVGADQNAGWEVRMKAEEIFGADAIEFRLLTEKKFIKVGGHNSTPVPAPIEAIAKKAECKLDVRDEDREMVRKGYDNLIQSLRLRDWMYCGYAAVSVDLPAEP
jgi:methylase of polypeptide subunit release factors